MMIEIDISISTIDVASSAAKQDKMTKSVNRNKTKLRVLCASGQSLDFEATSALMSPALPGNNMFNDGARMIPRNESGFIDFLLGCKIMSKRRMSKSKITR